MSDKNVTVRGGGISLSTVLLAIFVTLKLTGSIAWSWWWVLSPLWIPVALLLSFVVILGIVAGVAAAVEGIQLGLRKRRKNG